MIQLIQKAKEGAFIQEQRRSSERKAKSSFWASESEVNLLDIYLKFKEIPETNPNDFKSLWRFKCGDFAEKGLVNWLRETGIVKSADEDQQRVDFEYKSIRVTGYVDVVLTTGEPVEVKSFYGDYAERELSKGALKTNYLKQLAIYMYFLGQTKGYLYMIPMPMGEHFCIELVQYEAGKFRTGNYDFNLLDTFERWNAFYENHVLTSIEPPSEYVYKYPVQSIDWSKVNKADISKARNNQKVIGDWQIAYSPYRDYIIAKEGTTLGYSLAETNFIKSATAGYTKK